MNLKILQLAKIIYHLKIKKYTIDILNSYLDNDIDLSL